MKTTPANRDRKTTGQDRPEELTTQNTVEKAMETRLNGIAKKSKSGNKFKNTNNRMKTKFK